jgi:hypothetical protein
MKKSIWILAALVACSCYGQIDVQPFYIGEANPITPGTVRTSRWVNGMLEGIHITLTNAGAYFVTDEDGTADPKPFGQYKIAGTKNSSNYFTSLDGVWTLELTTNSAYVIRKTATTEYLAAAWTNVDGALCSTDYFANAFATGKVNVVIGTNTAIISVTALGQDGYSRILFSNSSFSTSGYYPIRAKTANQDGTLSNEVARIPIMDEAIVCQARGKESNQAVRVRVILNPN